MGLSSWWELWFPGLGKKKQLTSDGLIKGYTQTRVAKEYKTELKPLNSAQLFQNKFPNPLNFMNSTAQVRCSPGGSHEPLPHNRPRPYCTHICIYFTLSKLQLQTQLFLLHSTPAATREGIVFADRAEC